MRNLLKVVGGIILLYLVIVGGSGLAIRFLLTTSAGEELRRTAQASLPVEVSISGGELDLAEWFFLRPALSFDSLLVGNPEGYSQEALLRAQRVSARADLTSFFGDSLNVQSIAIVRPELRVEKAASGRTNLQTLMELLKAGKKAPAAEQPSENQEGSGRSLNISSFVIEDGTVRYLPSDPAEDAMVIQHLDITATDFAPGASFPVTLRAEMFEESAILLGFEGKTGPFSPASSPANGKLRFEAYPAKLPQRFREKYLGALLQQPGDSSRATVDVELDGDLMEVLSGSGLMRLEKLQLGRAGEPRLPLEGEAPLKLMLAEPLTNPAFDLALSDARLQLGQGSWSGDLEVRREGGRVQGRSRGVVNGVQMNEMLTALTSQKDKVFGNLELRRYDIRFAGKNAEEVKNSLRGSGSLEVSNGRLAMLDVLGTIEQKFNRLLGGEEAAAGTTSFITFATDFEVRDQRVFTPNLRLENEAARIGGAGSFGVNSLDLDYDLASIIRGALAQLLGGRANDLGVAEAAVPLTLGGSLNSPKLRPDFGAMAKQTAIRQAQGLLNDLLTRKSASQTEEGEAAPAAEEENKPKGLPFGLGEIFKRNLGAATGEQDAQEPAPPKP